MVDTALWKNGATTGFVCPEMGVIRGRPEDLESECLRFKYVAYPVFSLYEFFLPHCQTVLGGFPILLLTGSFPSLPILPSILAFF